MEKPKVSVIVPCYGIEKYLDRCMENLVNQTLKSIEIILVDDGSPDRVPQMCDDWAAKDSRIKVIHKQNAGLGFARNSGLDIATGEYVAFVDSDDYVDTTMYETLWNEAKSSNADVVFCGFKTETQTGIWRDSNEVVYRSEWTKEDVTEFMLDMVACAPKVKKERKYQMSVWHSIYRHSIIKENDIRFYSEREVVSEDIPFQIDFLKSAKKVIYIPKAYYHYCFNGNSLTATYKQEKYERYKTLRNVLLKKLLDISNSSNRVNRLFIGYVRANIINLLSSNIKNKDYILVNIINDKLWKDLKIEYPPSNLPTYSRIIYSLICDKQKVLLQIYIAIVIIAKKLINKNRY